MEKSWRWTSHVNTSKSSQAVEDDTTERNDCGSEASTLERLPNKREQVRTRRMRDIELIRVRKGRCLLVMTQSISP